NPRHISAHVRRAVRERDGDRCTYVSESGHRCETRHFLEFDHVVPVSRGGQATVENLRLRCRAHNQLAAERDFGSEFMNQKRAEARRMNSEVRAAMVSGAEVASTDREAAESTSTDRAESEKRAIAEARARAEASAMAERANDKDVVPWLRSLGYR